MGGLAPVTSDAAATHSIGKSALYDDLAEDDRTANSFRVRERLHANESYSQKIYSNS